LLAFASEFAAAAFAEVEDEIQEHKRLQQQQQQQQR